MFLTNTNGTIALQPAVNRFETKMVTQSTSLENA